MSDSTPPQYSSAAPTQYGNGVARYNVLSIVGFILAFLVSVAGLVISLIALSQIKKTGERGHGLALAGVIISIVSIVLSIIFYIIIGVAAAHNSSTGALGALAGIVA